MVTASSLNVRLDDKNENVFDEIDIYSVYRVYIQCKSSFNLLKNLALFDLMD